MQPATFEEWKERLAPLSVEQRPVETRFRDTDLGSLTERLTLFFESAVNLRRHLKEHAAFRPSASQARDISSCLRQGRELLRTSHATALVAKPIVLYYAMACYAKALVLSIGKPGRLNELPKKHGLKVIDNSLALEQIEVKVEGNDGLFHSFVRSLSEVSGVAMEIRDGPDLWIAINTCPRLTSVRCSLKHLLGRVIGLDDLFRATFSEPAACTPAQLRFGTMSSGDSLPIAALIFNLPAGLDEQWIAGIHHRLAAWSLRDRNGNLGDRERRGIAVFENLPATDPRSATREDQAAKQLKLEDLLIPFTRTIRGDYWLVGDVAGVTIPEPAIQLAAAFLLSSVARYRPDVWSCFCGFSPTDRNSHVRALVEAFLDRAAVQFPLQILGALGRTQVVVESTYK